MFREQFYTTMEIYNVYMDNSFLNRGRRHYFRENFIRTKSSQKERINESVLGARWESRRGVREGTTDFLGEAL